MHKGFSSLFRSNREALSFALLLQHNKFLTPNHLLLSETTLLSKRYRGGSQKQHPLCIAAVFENSPGDIFEKCFSGLGQPAGVLGDETGFERAHRADISPPDVFFFPWNCHDRVMQVLSLPPSFIWGFLLSTCSASQFCGFFQALSQSPNK